VTSGRFVHHVHSRLRSEIESRGRSADPHGPRADPGSCTDPGHRMDLGCRMDASSDDGCDGLSVDELRQLFVKQRNADDAFFADLGMSVSRITVIFYEM